MTSLTHYYFGVSGVLVKANYVNNFGCVLVHTTDNILAAQFVYSACVDCIVLLLSVYKLSRNGVTRSKFGYLLFRDGLIYVIIASVSLHASLELLLIVNSFL